MLKKELFKTEIEKLFNAHQCINVVTKEMLTLWYGECESLSGDDFKIAIKRTLYSPRNPKLYDILINLPKYNKDLHKTISDYTYMIYKNDTKETKQADFITEEFLKSLESDF